MIHADTERRMAEWMKPRRTIELDASHASLTSQPGAIVDLIELAATEARASSMSASIPAGA